MYIRDSTFGLRMPRSRIYTAGLRGNVKHFCLTFCTSVVVGHCCGQTIFSKHLQGDSWTWLSEQKIGDDIVTAQRPGWRMGGHTHTQHAHTDIHALNTHTQTYVTAQRPGWRMGGPGLHWPPISPQPFGEFARRSAL